MRFNIKSLLGLWTGLWAASASAEITEYNMPQGVTPISHDIYDLHMTIFYICVVIGILVFGVLIYSLFKFRRSRGAVAADFHHNTKLEVIWTIIPFIILVVMAIPSTEVLIRMYDTKKPDLTVKITGFQWRWQYQYLDSGISFFSNLSTPTDQYEGNAPKDQWFLREVDHPLVLPIHKKVRLLITANDVIHSWWVPEFGVKKDAIPGFIQETWVRIDEPGTYRGQCGVLCGVRHGFMPIVVIAMKDADYQQWIKQQQTAAEPGTVQTTSTNDASSPANSVKVATSEYAAAKSNTAEVATTDHAGATTSAENANSPQSATPATKTAAINATSNSANVTSSTKTALTLPQLMKTGQANFEKTCAACHKNDGSGMPPVFPALVGSKIATGPVKDDILRVLNGVPNTAMQAFSTQLNDDEIASIVTYTRNSWGNGDTAKFGKQAGGLVQASDVAALRDTH